MTAYNKLAVDAITNYFYLNLIVFYIAMTSHR